MSRQPAPPPKDTNNGRNEYIPQYISAKPFYAEDLLKDTEYLSHQRAKAEQKDTLDKAKWYERGRKSGPAATKYRKGACENCGAMTHKTRDCLSRPRKTGAKWSGRDIQADEVVEDVKLGWDAKRDRWNGYDVREYDSVVQDYEDMEGLKKATASKAVGGQIDEDDGNPNALTTITNPEDDDTRYAEETDMGRTQPTSTRQLRLREDTAKYLIDLDLDSAKYDPKTRSMDTTTQSINASKNNNSVDLASEGFVRPSHDPASDAAAFERAQRYAWESQERGAAPSTDPQSQTQTSTQNQQPPPQGTTKMHLEANPTASALQHKKHLADLAEKKLAQKTYLAERYGTSATTTTTNSTSTASSKPLPITSTSTYTTYDPATGLPLDPTTNKPLIKPVPKSKYPEDIFPGNHSSVFGSYWREGQWGFKCCGSFVRNSWCTGEEGRRGFEEEERRRVGLDGVGGGGGDQVEEILSGSNGSGRKRKAEGVVDEEGEKRSRTEEP